MSDLLVYLARTSRFGERFASRKLAMIALCNAASDLGDAIVMGAAEIAEAAELVDIKSAMRVRRELIAVGLIDVVTADDVTPPGQGRGAKGTYRINVARLKALQEGQWDYLAEARRLKQKGGETPPLSEPDRVAQSEHPTASERVARHHPNASEKGGAGIDEKGGAKGGVKGGAMGGAGPTSSIKDSIQYWIDDVPDLKLPGWSVEEVRQLEPERWEVLAEAFLRWDGARKAVDIGRAFIGWARSVLGIAKPGKGRIASRADWGMIYAMAGLSAEEARQGEVRLPSPGALAARAGGDWRSRLRSSGVAAQAVGAAP